MSMEVVVVVKEEMEVADDGGWQPREKVVMAIKEIILG